MSYLWETHCHTSESSDCGKTSAAEQVARYRSLGYDGIVISDHFLNTYRSRISPWDEVVNRQFSGYRAALEAADGFPVLHGLEYGCDGSDYLVYGLKYEWLMEHAELQTVGIPEFLAACRDVGALIVHAHPFREAGYIKMFRLLPRQVDGVEVLNANRTDFENLRAAEYAEAYGLLPFAGSDCHTVQNRYTGIRLDEQPATEEDFISAVRAGSYRCVTVFDGRPDLKK